MIRTWKLPCCLGSSVVPVQAMKDWGRGTIGDCVGATGRIHAQFRVRQGQNQ